MENLASLRRKVRRLFARGSPPQSPARDPRQIVPDLRTQPGYVTLLRSRIQSLGIRGPLYLLDPVMGSQPSMDSLASALGARHVAWTRTEPPAPLPADASLIIGALLSDDAQRRSLTALRESHPGRVFTLEELLLPLTTIEMAQKSLEYRRNTDTIDGIAPFYCGERFLGPIDKLNELFPLEGTSVIELGPLDGCQTAGLLHHGVKSVTCIEARAENVIKMLVAAHALVWEKVDVVPDDYHNANASRYGRYDLVFAHGVYYHSSTPFLFFENMMSLADAIFIGGFCATDALPPKPAETLHYEGASFRVKRFVEGVDYLSGIHPHGYYFYPEDLIRFFRDRNYLVRIVSDETGDAHLTGRYLRFLATKEAMGEETPRRAMVDGL